MFGMQGVRNITPFQKLMLLFLHQFHSTITHGSMGTRILAITFVGVRNVTSNEYCTHELSLDARAVVVYCKQPWATFSRISNVRE